MAEPDLDPPARKAALRAEILAARTARSDAERATAGRLLARHATQRLTAARVVAAYLSFGAEPPTTDLINALHGSGAQVIVPVVDGAALDWVAVDTGGDGESRPAVAAGALGIPEPAGQRLGSGHLHAADVVLVPALAADRHGNRLGRGRGFYDRALASVASPVVAVVYDEELLDVLPFEAHDRRVDAVLTPSGWLHVAAG